MPIRLLRIPAFHPQQAGGYPAEVLYEGRDQGTMVEWCIESTRDGCLEAVV